MKMNIDESFKKSLEGHEMPFDPKAWDAMSKRLDQTMPVNGSSTWKWFLGGAAVVGIVITSATLLNTGEEAEKIAKKAENLVESVQNTPGNGTSDNDAPVNSVENGSSTAATGTNASGQVDQEYQNNNITETPQQRNSENNANSNTQSGNQSSGNQNNTDRPNDPDPNQKPERVKEVVLPVMDNACQGETVKIDNRNNEVAIYVIDPSNNRTSVKAGTKGSVVLNEEGTYVVAHIENGTILKKESFLALTAPKVDISYDRDRPFDGGVPTTSLTTSSIGTSYEWSFPSINQNASGKTAEAHFFNDGQHEVKLTVTGTNGCKASETVKIEIDNNYNLLAEGMFNPNSTIAVNREFMPDALVIRNTPFTLYVIEPSTGAIIYETSDASQPWTGVDKRNGQMVEFNSTFIWKVVLKNPLEGEKSNYAGTIVLTSNR